jgi:hypothetical protein
MVAIAFGLVASLAGSITSASATTSLSTITLRSAPGMRWQDHAAGTGGAAVLTYGHIGCESVDAHGNCQSGVWPLILKARWIWKSQLVTADEATNGDRVEFRKQFSLPPGATGINAAISVTADNKYSVFMNGQPIGSDSDYASIETYAFDPVPGKNVLRILVVNFASTCTPQCNPAGLEFRADISYQG